MSLEVENVEILHNIADCAFYMCCESSSRVDISALDIMNGIIGVSLGWVFVHREHMDSVFASFWITVPLIESGDVKRDVGGFVPGTHIGYMIS
jgi:hypothetical protein